MQEQSHRPPAQNEEIDLLELASILLTHWWKIAIVTLLGALILLGYAQSRYVPTYQATAKLYINNTNISIGISKVSVNSGDLSTSAQLVEVYSELINSHLVLDAVGETMEEKGFSGFDYYNLAGRITAKAAGTTQMLNLSAWDTSPERAIAIVNSLVETLPNIAENIIEGSSVIAIDPAYSAKLLASSIRRQTLMGAMVGFAVSAGLILLYYYFLNDLVEKQDWLLTTFPAIPQLGCVPDMLAPERGGYGKAAKKKKHRRGNAELGENLSFFGTEAYNVLRTNVKFSFHGKATGHVIGLTSAVAGDGKTYTALNLAYAMAKDNSRVLLIDGDMRKLTLNHYFPDVPKIGLSEVLCGQASATDVIHNGLLHEHLSILLSGSMPPNPSELLGSESMQQLLSSLKEQYDYVLLDLPPVGSVIDAAAVSEYLDGMIVVVRHDHTHKKSIRSTIRQLELPNVRLLGFVYNANVEHRGLYGKYRYYYDYHSYEYKKDDSASAASVSDRM